MSILSKHSKLLNPGSLLLHINTKPAEKLQINYYEPLPDPAQCLILPQIGATDLETGIGLKRESCENQEQFPLL